MHYLNRKLANLIALSYSFNINNHISLFETGRYLHYTKHVELATLPHVLVANVVDLIK